MAEERKEMFAAAGGGDLSEKDTEESGLSDKALRAVFDEFDKDSSGALDAEEFQIFLFSLGDARSDEECARILAELDKDGDGTVDFAEFRDWYKNSKREGAEGLAMNALRFSLSAKYMRHRLGNALDSVSNVSDATSVVDLELGVGDPDGAMRLRLEQLTSAELHDVDTQLSVFLSLHPTAAESAVTQMISVFRSVLDLYAGASGVTSTSVELVQHDGQRAIALRWKFPEKVFQQAETRMGVNPMRLFSLTNCELLFNFALAPLLKPKNATTIRDMLAFRFKLAGTVTERSQALLQTMWVSNLRRQTGPQRRWLMAMSNVFGFAARSLRCSIVLDDPVEMANMLLRDVIAAAADGDDAPAVAAQNQVDALAALMAFNPKCMSVFRHIYVATARKDIMDKPARSDILPQAVTLLAAALDPLTQAVKGVSGVRFESGSDGVELHAENFDVFTLLGDPKGRKKHGKPVAGSADITDSLPSEFKELKAAFDLARQDPSTRSD